MMSPMISFFTIPKPFVDDHTSRSQMNAVGSWKQSFPEAEILVFGDEPGIAEATARLGVRHVASIERNELGTPLLSSAYQSAERLATNRVLCYLNADIILTPAFAPAVHAFDAPTFLLLGRRTNLDVTEPLDFRGNWAAAILRRAEEEGRLEAPWGSDFFAFPKGSGFAGMPPFAVGRPNWDNWMIAFAREHDIPVVDLTPACVVVHQNHGYAHVRHAREKKWDGPEGDRNRELAGGGHSYTVLDANYRLTPAGPRRVTILRRTLLQGWHSALQRMPDTIQARLRRLKL
jgi:hypothetical protein